MKQHRRPQSVRSFPAGESLLAAAAAQLAQSLHVADPRNLKPGELIRSINSTPLGQVVSEKTLRAHRERAGLRISDADGKRLDLLRYAAWLVHQRHKGQDKKPAPDKLSLVPQGTPDVAARAAGGNAEAYALKKERERARNAAASETGRDIGELPPIADPERRARALADPEFFSLTYFPLRFKKRLSNNHRGSIAGLKRVAEDGGKKAMADPRGDGKTTRCEVMAIWTVLSGRRKFVPLIGATRAASLENLESIKGEFEFNDLLAADFPEVCFPIRALEGIHNRCKGQLYLGEPTRIKWSGDMLVLPTIEGSPASGSVICCRGLLGRIRGMKHRLPDGTTMRPDCVVVDDFQTRQSARSARQCERRLKILTGDIIGLAGPGESIAMFVPCTVIERGDAADQLLNHDLHPEFKGVRTKLLESLPTDLDLWDEYAVLRRAGHLTEVYSAANAFYKKHRKRLDAGAKPTWLGRYDEEAGELSAIQHAMNLRIDHPDTFDAEYQNEPRDPTSDDDKRPTAKEIEGKLSGLPRRKVHLASTVLTAFIDVQQRLLYWGAAAWSPEFTGGLIDYGTWPDQGRNYFLYRDAARTIQQQFPTAEVTGSIRGALDALIAQLVSTVYVREGGAEFRIQKLLIDSGDWSDIIYQCCRESPHAGLLLPSKGLGISADKAPISEWKRHPGRLIGEEWQLGAVENRRAVRLLTFDTNYWKRRLDQGLTTAAGDRGCITLFGEKKRPPDHSMIAAHCLAETREKTIAPARGRTVFIYKLKPEKPDNHLLDVCVGNAVCASLLGCRLIGNPMIPTKPKPRSRPRVSPLSC